MPFDLKTQIFEDIKLPQIGNNFVNKLFHK